MQDPDNCKALFVAVILQAVADHHRPHPLTEGEGDARKFLFGGGEYGKHRRWVCQHAGIDPRIITRENLAKARKFQNQRTTKKYDNCMLCGQEIE